MNELLLNNHNPNIKRGNKDEEPLEHEENYNFVSNNEDDRSKEEKIIQAAFPVRYNHVKTPSEVSTFWHLTDLHLDFYYNLSAENRSEICPSSDGKVPTDPGPFGDHRYDN